MLFAGGGNIVSIHESVYSDIEWNEYSLQVQAAAIPGRHVEKGLSDLAPVRGDRSPPFAFVYDKCRRGLVD